MDASSRFIALWRQEHTPRKRITRFQALWLILGIGILLGALGIWIFFNLNAQQPQNQTRHIPGKVAVLTASYDNMRTGQNRQESILTQENVNAETFGLRFSYSVYGQVQAQPLYVPNVQINGQMHNVIYVATTKDYVYAFDADNGKTSPEPLWQVDLGLTDGPGIFGTPVISLDQQGGGTLYVVTNDGEAEEHLHALDITTGEHRSGSPSLIAFEGFNAATARQRTGLVLVDNIIYGGWMASEFSKDAEHGWVLAFDTRTLKLVGAFNTTAGADTKVTGPNKGNGLETGNPGSVWQSTTGLSADADGYVYPIVSNGPLDAHKGGNSYGDAFVKLRLHNGKLEAVDYFSPFNQQCLMERDHDLGSGGNLIIPDQTGAHPHLMFSGSKNGHFYLVDRDNLGKYVEVPDLTCGTAEERRTDIDRIVQETEEGLIPGLFMAPVYWKAPDGRQFIYVSGANADTAAGDTIKAFELIDGKLNLTPVMQTALTYGYPGAGIAVTSNGDQAGTGILWALQPAHCEGGGCEPEGAPVLHAYDASDLQKELYNSEQNADRDGMDSYQKFTRPVVADGRVIVCSQSGVYIYGLLK